MPAGCYLLVEKLVVVIVVVCVKVLKNKSSKMGARDDEYDYLFKGKFISEGG